MDELKFQVGDRVRRVCGSYRHMSVGHEDEIIGFRYGSTGQPAWRLKAFGAGHDGDNLALVTRAKPATGEPVYAGHHPDGSSIQNHSARPLYPYVLVYRDKKGGPDAFGKDDVGVIGPKHDGTIWCKDFHQAVALAEHLKEGLV